MYFEWDEQKRASNFEKHGIDLADAARAFAGPTLERIDDRMDYGETRIVALGEVEGVTLCVVYTIRDDVIRLIIPKVGDTDSFHRLHRPSR